MIDNDHNGKFRLQAVKGAFGGDDIDEILRHCHACGDFSDIYLSDESRIVVKSHGLIYPVFDQRPLRMEELSRFFMKLTDDPAAASTVLQGNPYDGSYSHLSVKDDNRSRPVRYRANAISYLNPKAQKGIQLTMRTINFVPPKLAAMALEKGIFNNISPRQGLVIVSGETGSGKTTLLASVLRYRMEMKNGHCIINAYEAPIEYLHSELAYQSDPTNQIYQTEVNPLGWIKSFAVGIRASLRRNPNGFLIGECRDLETIEASIRAASSGHFVYTTTHANSVSDTITRFINEFPSHERQARYYEMISNLRLIVAQYLAVSVDGKRVPIREYLVFSKEVRDQLKAVEFKDSERMIRKIIDDQGQFDSEFAQSTSQSAKHHLDIGAISQETYDLIISGV
ncbi:MULTISPECIES: type IV pilus twitching motility protein PilT [Aeromonas]|uniref:Bacterial type II secretion system protein E domain-containing protein n=1 Tax=Aeromonas veronii TaxID=654 RepID=A0A4S5CJW9_AERVE|nr:MULTISPECIES: ATPase, T2SS/T4P/T4SS family [Aeromonas]THJ43658.1 hypothetical protein E8Q35_15240 [Aeromonas veronii]